ncbi:MAG: ATP-binding cassette domain-containing protein [Anaerococcus sp.]|nr:ATP-binding cassette domain-containing protein [Peptoniphilaceae bacterium]MDY2918201.1 ATP-binding cassette domain-containing protein [Anaerococcus sp.]
MILKCENISKHYGLFKKPVLANINLSLDEGKKMILTGPSGSGKTTLLKILAIIDLSFKGKYYIDDKNVNKIDPSPLRKKISYVYQEYGLLENESVYENIKLGVIYNNLSKDEINSRCEMILKLLELDGFHRRIVSLLSGGQRQRVVLARALIRDSEILIADEPFSSLDDKLIEKILEYITNKFNEKNIIMSFHQIPTSITFPYDKYELSDGTLRKTNG